jgi:hypothetical protein
VNKKERYRLPLALVLMLLIAGIGQAAWWFASEEPGASIVGIASVGAVVLLSLGAVLTFHRYRRL